MSEEKEASTARRLAVAVLPTVIGLSIAVLSFYLLSNSFESVTWSSISESLQRLTPQCLLLAGLATVVSFVALGFYDVLAVETVAPGKVSRWIAGAAGAAAYAVSNFLGFPVLTGGAVRFVIYHAQGLSHGDIGRIIGSTWMALWFAILLVVGLALVLDPEGIALLDYIPDAIEQLVGLAILAGLSAFFTWVATGDRSLRIGKLEMPLPGGRIALGQMLIGFIDLAAAGASLYVLLPANTDVSIGGFAIVYTLAVVVTVVTHAPGGLGVFEATIITGLGLQDRADVLASLIAYRFIYYAVPFGLTILGITGGEVLRHRRRLNTFGKRLTRILDPLIPPAAGALAFLGGLVLLISGVTPAEPDRLSELHYAVPLPFVQTSHFLGSVTGVCLLVLARGLLGRLERAWLLTMGFLAAGAVFSLLKGLDYEEATISLIIGAILWVFRSSFYRRPPGRIGYITLGWLAVVTLTVGAAITLGVIAYQDVSYRESLWWDFAWHGDAPRFLRAAVGMLVVIVAIGIDALVHRRFHSFGETFDIPPVIETLVARSPVSEHHLALLGDKQFLISEDESAFIMYGVAGRSYIAMGDPVGNIKAARKLVWDFCEKADAAAGRAVFYCARPEFLPFYLDLGFSLLKIGEFARVDLHQFTLQGKAGYENRYAVNRAQRDGLVFEIIPRDQVPQIMPQLRSVSDQWLEEKQGSEKGFSLGYFDEENLKRFDCAVMKKDGEIVAFANLWRGGGLEEASVDLMRFKSGVSKVLMDALFIHVMLTMKEEGFRWFNLGSAPLSGLSSHPLASSWNKLGSILFRRGGVFYSFEGIRAFKSKYNPVWVPLYIACPGGLALPQILMDLTSLISGGPRLEQQKT